MSGPRFKMIGDGQEVDGGMFVVKDASGNVLLTVYQPTTTSAKWNAGNIYYNRTTTAWPSSADTTLDIECSSDAPSTNDDFACFNTANFLRPANAPAASNVLFVASDQTWGFNMSGLSGTGSTTGGRAVWWSTAARTIALADCTLSNGTSLDSSTTYAATDSPSS